MLSLLNENLSSLTKPEILPDVLDVCKKSLSIYEFINKISNLSHENDFDTDSIEFFVKRWSEGQKENFLSQQQLNILYTATQYFTFGTKKQNIILYRGIRPELKNGEYNFEYIRRIKQEKKITTNNLTSFTTDEGTAINFAEYSERQLTGLTIQVTVPTDKAIMTFNDWFLAYGAGNAIDEYEYVLYNTDILDVKII